MRFIIILLCSILLSSCGKSWYCEKAMQKGCFKNDTITVKDTFVTKEIKSDTVFSDLSDTVEIVKDKLTIRYVHYHDSIYITAHVPADTIIKEVKVHVLQPAKPKSKLDKIRDKIIEGLAIIGGLSLLYLILIGVPRKKKS